MVRVLWTALIAGAVSLTCVGNFEPPEPVCEAATLRECLCDGGGSGLARCADDGSEWGPCECTPGDADGDIDADGDGDGDSDVDGDGDGDGDMDADADADIATDADGDEDCPPVPTGIDLSAIEEAGCLGLDDPTLGNLEVVADSCDLDTTTCTFDCVTDWPSTCFVTPTATEPRVCVVVVTSMVIDNHFSIRGDAPVLVMARDVIVIASEVDAEGIGQNPGPGGHAGGDTGLTGDGLAGGGGFDDTVDETIGGGGGAGAAGLGGAGGCQSGGLGGPLIVNCGDWSLAGGSGGGGGGGYSGGAGGGGGGGLWLFARQEIILTGESEIDVDGAAGGSVIDNEPSGGGGGGAGGRILLEAPSIVVEGRLEAGGQDGGNGSSPFVTVSGGLGGRERLNGESGYCDEVGGGGGGAAGQVSIRTDPGGLTMSGSVLPVAALCVSTEMTRICEE